MFAYGSFGFNVGGNGVDPDAERDPPPDATEVFLPDYRPQGGVTWNSASSCPDFRSLFSKITKPGDISDEHVTALNISALPPETVDTMLPFKADGTSYIPPMIAAPLDSEDHAAIKARKDFDERLTELRIDNDTAYRVVTRRMSPGVKPPRIGQTRKVWEALEVMSQYWDCSQDRYYEAATPTDEECRSVKRPRPMSDFFGRDEHPGGPATRERAWPLHSITDSSISGEPNDEEETPHLSHVPFANDNDWTAVNTNKPQSTMRYKGRRTSTGTYMPELFRVAAAKSFVEATVHTFGTMFASPRVMPIVQFGKMSLPVRQTGAVYRKSTERTKARQGIVSGPILTVQIRPEVEFRAKSQRETTDKARLDFMREIGGLLQIAQERRRQHQSEVKPGEGRWWTTRPRWGGGPGGEMENDIENSDVIALAEEAVETAGRKMASRVEGLTTSRKKKAAPAIMWKDVRPGKGFWDPKIDYEAIGKKVDSDYDEVFMVSSLYHHISIVKLTIHDAYTDCLISGSLPDPQPADAEWSRPKLQRSQWYDLLDVDQRVEAFRGLWGVMAYLTRSQEP